MRPHSALLAAGALLAGGCDMMDARGASVPLSGSASDTAQSSDPAQNEVSPDKPSIAVMTSLPLYWAIDADLAALASGNAVPPWPRVFLEQRYTLVPVDTLSPIPALSPGESDTDPLAGVEQLAIVQPRGLSPADNVALDRWVRGGGRLLLVLDPALTGHYPLPLGDPRLPSYTALIPPVVARWGLEIRVDERAGAPSRGPGLPDGQELLVRMAGEIHAIEPGAGECAASVSAPAASGPMASGPMVQCAIGAGRVTLVADAALFEHRELAGATGQRLRALMAYAFDEAAS